MYIYTQYNTIVNFDKFEKIDIKRHYTQNKWIIWAIKNDKAVNFDGIMLGDFEYFTDATRIVNDMAKKIELGRAIYIMPTEVKNDE